MVGLDRDGLHLLGGRTSRTIRDNVLPVITELLGSRAVVVREGSGDCTLLGQRVLMIGMGDVTSAAKIKGLTLTSAYVDELTECHPEGVAMLTSRLDRPGSNLIATTNPAGPMHWVHRDVVKNDAWHLETFNLWDNPTVAPSYYHFLRATHDATWIRRYVDGQWVAAEGVVWPAIADGSCTGPVPDNVTLTRYYLGVDAGSTHPTAAVLVAEGTDRRAYVVGVYKRGAVGGRSVDNVGHVDSIVGWLARNERRFPGCSTPHVVWASPDSASLRAALRIRGYPVHAADNRVLDGIAWVNSLAATDTLVIIPECEELLAEAMVYSWDPKATERGKDEPMKVEDDVCDALRYVCMGREPVWKHWVAQRAMAGVR